MSSQDKKMMRHIFIISFVLLVAGCYSAQPEKKEPITPDIFKHLGSGHDQVSMQKETALGPAIKPEINGDNKNKYVVVDSRMPSDMKLNKTTEIYIVSGYEPRNDSNKKVSVKIDRPGHDVVLIATAYESVLWDVQLTPKTGNVVLLSSGGNQRYNAAEKRISAYDVPIRYAYEPETPEFLRMIDFVKDRFGRDHLDGFFGGYIIPSDVEITGPRRDWYLSRAKLAAPVQIKKDQLSRIVSAVRNDILASSSANQHFVNLEKGGRAYIDKELKISSGNDKDVKEYKLPANFPDFSWVSGMAVDPESGILMIVSFGGEGALYRFDLKARRWLDYRSMNDIDARGLDFLTGRNVFIAPVDEDNFMILDKNGAVREQIKISIPSIKFLYDHGNEPPPHLGIVTMENDILYYACQGNSYLAGGCQLPSHAVQALNGHPLPSNVWIWRSRGSFDKPVLVFRGGADDIVSN